VTVPKSSLGAFRTAEERAASLLRIAEAKRSPQAEVVPMAPAPSRGLAQALAEDELHRGPLKPRPEPAKRASAPTLEQVVLTRVSDVEREKVRWLWQGRIPRGKLTVLDGDPGLGKSTFTLDLAARITTGTDLPTGHMISKGPRSVVLLSAEDAIGDTIRPRLEAAGANLDLVHVFEHVLDAEGVPRSPSIPMDVAHIEEMVTRVGADLVVIDPLMAYLGAGVDSHRDQDVRRAMHALADMANRTGAAVLILRHLTKTSGGSAIYRGGGSIGIMGAVRAGMLVAVDPEEPERRILAPTKANLGKLADSLAYRLVDDPRLGVARVVWEGVSHHRADDLVAPRTDETEGGALTDACAILSSILADGPVWSADVVKQAGAAQVTKATLRRAKTKLGVKAIKVGRPGDPESGWKWRLSEGAHEDAEGAHAQTLSTFADGEHLRDGEDQ